MTKTPKAYGIRLSDADSKRLDQEAGKLGLSPTAYARELIVDALNEDRRPGGQPELDRLRREVSTLSAEVARLAEAVQEVGPDRTNSESPLLGHVSEEVAKLRKDLYNGLLKLLALSGAGNEKMTRQQVAAWAAKHLSPE